MTARDASSNWQNAFSARISSGLLGRPRRAMVVLHGEKKEAGAGTQPGPSD
jgi:hypothetical protein